MSRTMQAAVLAALFACSAYSQPLPVYVVLFTHIEDNTPTGILGSAESRIAYMNLRNRLIDMGNLAVRYAIPWSFQPDWKMLLAALAFEDSATRLTTNGKNLLRFLREDRSVSIDPHSHENGGYNYTDVAHLLDSLGVGGSTVIGGHVWDPALPQFQQWDRFRMPVRGLKFPWASWRGAILMGSGTPNHVNDPVVSGVWRPMDRYHYFTHDSTANITTIGQYKSDIASIQELIAAYTTGAVQPSHMLTASYHIKPADLTAAGGIAGVENAVLKPLDSLRARKEILLTDFTSLVTTWQRDFQAKGFLYQAPTNAGTETAIPSGALSVQNYPNPFNPVTTIRYHLPKDGKISLRVYDMLGREIVRVYEGRQNTGSHEVRFDGGAYPGGVYVCRVATDRWSASRCMLLLK